jgi:hypothetical protein
MRNFFLSLCAALTLLACSEQDSRPAKEVVAQAKGAAADAKETAHEAADSVRATAQDARDTASAAAAKADRAVNDAARAVQDGVNTAADTTRAGAENVAQGVRELGQGGVVTGKVSVFSAGRLALRPEAAGPAELRVDDRTRYLLHGGGLRRASLPPGTRVKATYVVEAQVPIATEVEVLAK